VSGGALRALNISYGRGAKILLQLDLVNLVGGGVSGLDSRALASALVSSLNSSLLSGILNGTGTINVVQTLNTLGIVVPDNFCVTPINLSAVSLGTLCANNAVLVQSLRPNATIDLQDLLDRFNVTLPPNSTSNFNLTNVTFDQICAPNISSNNITFDLSNVTSGACFGGFNLTNLPSSQIGLFLSALDPGVLSGLLVPQLDALLKPSYNLTVVDIVEAPDGKWPGVLGNVVHLEMSGIPQLLSRMLPQNTAFLTQLISLLSSSGNAKVNITGGSTLSSLVRSAATLNTILGALRSLTTENMPDYALLVVIMIKNRYPTYLQDAVASQRSFVAITNELANSVGFNFTVVPTVPVQETLSGILFVKVWFLFFSFRNFVTCFLFFAKQLFLDQIFGSVMAVLVVLGSMLIYSLLLGNVSDKTYEYGMLRALGFERTSLIGLLFITAMFFTLPGIGLGLLAAWLVWVPISLILQILTKAPSDYVLDYSAIVLGVIVGFVMPIVANIGPIRRALSRTLRDSLDVYHNVQSETTVKMVKLKGMGLSLTQLIVSVIMIVMGFLVYYLIPYAFTYNNFALFLGVLQVILLCMVLGMCLVAATTQPLIERGVLWLIVWGSDAKLLDLMNKNMSAHRSRNQKTALMFTLSLGFMIFAGASFSLQAATLQDTISSLIGADINVFAPSWSVPLPEQTLRNVLEQEFSQPGTLLRDWAFASFALRGSKQRVSDTRLSNLAGRSNRQIQIYGLESNHLNVVYSQFYVLSESDTSVKYNHTVNGSPDVIGSLWFDAGQQKLPQEAPPFVIPDDILVLPPTGTNAQIKQVTQTENNTQVYTRYLDVVIRLFILFFVCFIVNLYFLVNR
jgi:ABC-type antimicrobial peptide transport system permease subunit